MTILLCYDCLSTRKKWSKSVSTCVRWWLSLERGRMANTIPIQIQAGKYKCDKLSCQTSWRNGADPVWRVVQADWRFDQQVFFNKFFLLFKGLTNKCVGILQRARKHRCVIFELPRSYETFRLVHFAGDTLWQGEDDKKLVTLIRRNREVQV